MSLNIYILLNNISISIERLNPQGQNAMTETSQTERLLWFLDRDFMHLSEIQATHSAYMDSGAKAYSNSFEWNETVASVVLERVLVPFFDLLENAPHGPILFAGCGSGRDMWEAMTRGYDVVGLDQSSTMLDLAKQFLSEKKAAFHRPVGTFELIHGDITVMHQMFPKHKFSAIHCESAFGHLQKADIPSLIEHFSELVQPGGLAALGFRETASGYVYGTRDEVGTRYFTSWTAEQLEELFTSRAHLFCVHEKRLNPHSVEGRPPFAHFFLKKVDAS